jgi:osmotically-inducible protein OsmY
MYERLQRFIHTGVAAAVLLTGCAMAAPQQDPQGTGKSSRDSDNTKANTRDRSESEPTADQAKNGKSDREMMQEIRKAVMDDKSLSTYAHNVKIISRNGKITLKGPVQSEEEKTNIESKATEVAGAGNVTNELTVKGQKPEKAKKHKETT